MSKINFCRILGLQTFHVEHFMVKKALTLLLISITLSFADIIRVDDSIQDSTISIELSNIYENKYNPFNVMYLGGIGYTSSKRIEADVSYMSAFNAGTKLFGIDRLLIDLPLLRFDFRFERTDGERKIQDFSIGSLVSVIGFGILGKVAPKGGIISKIAMGGWWLASGSTKYILLGDNIYGVAFAESHAFEWFLQRSTYNKTNHYSLNEFGFIEQIGIQASLVPLILSNITAGVSFEITNKQRNIGWFVKAMIFSIPFEKAPTR